MRREHMSRTEWVGGRFLNIGGVEKGELGKERAERYWARIGYRLEIKE